MNLHRLWQLQQTLLFIFSLASSKSFIIKNALTAEVILFLIKKKKFSGTKLHDIEGNTIGPCVRRATMRSSKFSLNKVIVIHNSIHQFRQEKVVRNDFITFSIEYSVMPGFYLEKYGLKISSAHRSCQTVTFRG